MHLLLFSMGSINQFATPSSEVMEHAVKLRDHNPAASRLFAVSGGVSGGKFHPKVSSNKNTIKGCQEPGDDPIFAPHVICYV